jgi:hypothetical protein
MPSHNYLSHISGRLMTVIKEFLLSFNWMDIIKSSFFHTPGRIMNVITKCLVLAKYWIILSPALGPKIVSW